MQKALEEELKLAKANVKRIESELKKLSDVEKLLREEQNTMNLFDLVKSGWPNFMITPQHYKILEGLLQQKLIEIYVPDTQPKCGFTMTFVCLKKPGIKVQYEYCRGGPDRNQAFDSTMAELQVVLEK